jgi:ribose transport system permease protein
MTQTNQTSISLGIPGERRGFDRGALVAWAKEQYPLYILIVLLVIAGFATDAFFTQRNLTNLILQASVIGIVTLAQFIVVLTGGIDISVGSSGSPGSCPPGCSPARVCRRRSSSRSLSVR